MVKNYENMLEKAYRTFLSPGNVAIDIGGHIGRHTIPLANTVGSKGKVFVFEPLPDAYSEMKNNIAKKCDDRGENIVAYNLALGDEDGEAEFIYLPDFPEYSGFKERVYDVKSPRKVKIKVDVRRLDSFIDDFGEVRFIKIDAEGGELSILRGGKRLIVKSQPIISIEAGNASLINYSYDAGDYYDFFDDLGYKVYSIFGVRLKREEFILATAEQKFWDYIMFPAGETWIPIDS